MQTESQTNKVARAFDSFFFSTTVFPYNLILQRNDSVQRVGLDIDTLRSFCPNVFHRTAAPSHKFYHHPPISVWNFVTPSTLSHSHHFLFVIFFRLFIFSFRKSHCDKLLVNHALIQKHIHNYSKIFLAKSTFTKQHLIFGIVYLLC